MVRRFFLPSLSSTFLTSFQKHPHGNSFFKKQDFFQSFYLLFPKEIKKENRKGGGGDTQRKKEGMEKRPALSKTTYFSCSQKVPELCMFAMHLHNSASVLSKFGYCSAVGSQRLAKLVWRERDGGTRCPAEPRAAKLFRGAGNRLLLQCPLCPRTVGCSTPHPSGGVERGNANTPLIEKP